jgi:hypothetical protein
MQYILNVVNNNDAISLSTFLKNNITELIDKNYNKYTTGEQIYSDYIQGLYNTMAYIEAKLKDITQNDNIILVTKLKNALLKAIKLGSENTKEDIDDKLNSLSSLNKLNSLSQANNDNIKIFVNDYGMNHKYDPSLERPNITDVDKLMSVLKEKEKSMDGGRGNRRNKATPKSKAKPKHDDMTMKDIKELCKANQIKLSRVVEGKRVAYKKKELITKLKRKKLL